MNTYCPICFKSKKTYLITECKHFFCRPCIRKWSQSSQYETRCPLCRKDYLLKNLKLYKPSDKKINKVVTSNYRLRSKTKDSRIKFIVKQLKDVRDKEFDNREDEIKLIHSTISLIYNNIYLLNKQDSNIKNILFNTLNQINFDDYREINIWKWKFNEYFD